MPKGSVSKKREGWLVAIAVADIVLVFFCIGWFYWDELNEGESVSATIRNLSLVAGALIAIVLAVWRSVIANRQVAAAHTQVETGLEQTRIAQESLLRDRYQRATEMLGHESAVVRIGGVQALTLLAIQDPDTYHHPVWQLLTTLTDLPKNDLERESRVDSIVASDALRVLQEIEREEREPTLEEVDLVPPHSDDPRYRRGYL